MNINVIGAGLAGCEAAYQIAKRGIKVNLYEMKPLKKSPAHKSDLYAELVCSNSFKANRVNSAAGLLKEEMRCLDSLLLKAADKSRVPAGGALAVDRDIFSKYVTECINSNNNINVINEEITDIDDDDITVIATGPLTSDALAEFISKMFGESLSFYDAAAPIVDFKSVDMGKAFFESRYGKGDKTDYLNCPMNKDEYEVFYDALINAERAPVKDFDVRDPKVYEGCMPIEVMAQRGHDTIRFGPMKPVGLTDPNTGHRPWAVLQLRKENSSGTMYNLVGFQTNLKWGAQKELLHSIPGLENCNIVRYGVMHRNTFINSPKLLNPTLQTKKYKNIFFAGQITGTEGYTESIASGLLAGINMSKYINNEPLVQLPTETMLGALTAYITFEGHSSFQPINSNWGILSKPVLEKKILKNKKLKNEILANRALETIKNLI